MTRKVLLTPIFMSAFMIMLTLAGCAVDKPQYFPLPAKVQSLSGVLLEGEGGLWFQPCYERLWWPVQDLTEQQELTEIYQKFTALSREVLYVELQGAVDASQSNRLLVKTVDTVGGTAQTCHFSLEGLEFRAASSKPVWVADIRTSQVLVKSVNPPGSYSFYTVNETAFANDPQGKQDSDAGGNSQPETVAQGGSVTDAADITNDLKVVAFYREKTPSKTPLQIKIIQKRCIDSVTGTLLPFTAEMRFYGQLYPGCARKGQPLNSEINGFYWYQPEGKPQVMFKLSADQRVQLVTRDSQGKTVTERGRWQQLQSGKLIFSMRDVVQREYLMLFFREPDGRLILQTGSEHLVSLGAAFKLWRPSGLEGGQVLAIAKPANEPTEQLPLPTQTLPGAAVVESSLIERSAVSSSLSESVLPDSQVQAADIDAELLNEIMVNEVGPGNSTVTGTKDKP
ncbi:hypothetical protein [uncultured Amphritea sp.]|uniref:hypothetical protein n=1 Tax=uncultured Amphritea sp. TaxID=981605 RepID=UPI00261DC15C|nr:hypothetical protein [uncultured Amphritea sp.]